MDVSSRMEVSEVQGIAARLFVEGQSTCGGLVAAVEMESLGRDIAAASGRVAGVVVFGEDCNGLPCRRCHLPCHRCRRAHRAGVRCCRIAGAASLRVALAPVGRA